MLTRRQLLLSTAIFCAMSRSGVRTSASEPSKGAVPQDLPPNETPQNWLEHHAKQWRAQYNLPGLSCALMLNGKIVADVAVGVRKWGNAQPLFPDDALQIGSITKPITAALTAKMVERGVLAWSTKMTDVFPELSGLMQPEYHDVTVLLLLSHLSGMPYKPLTEPEDAYATLPLRQGRYEYVKAAVLDRPQGKAGADFIYGGGPIIVAAMLEKLTNRTWEELVTRVIFEPLQMTTAVFGAEPGANPEGAEAVWEHSMENGHPVPLQAAGEYGGRFNFARTHGPAGSINCSASDLLAFMSAYFPNSNGSTPFFSAASYKTLTTKVNNIKSPGWGVDGVSPQTAQAIELAHGGSNLRNLAEARFCPQTRSGFVWMTNVWDKSLEAFQSEGGKTLIRATLTQNCVDAPEFDVTIDDQVNGLTVEWWQFQPLIEGYIRPQHTFVLRPDDLHNRLAGSTSWSDGNVVFDSGNYPQDGRLQYTPKDSIFNGWQHFAMVVDRRSRHMSIYRNGKLEAEKEGGRFLSPGKYMLCVGGDIWPFPGQLKEFRVWNHARSIDQIRAGLRETMRPQTEQLLAYYKGQESKL